MKRIWLLLWVSLWLVACDKNIDPQPEASRTVLAFFWANNNLDGDLKGNVKNMIEGLHRMNESATLLVYWDGRPSDRIWPTPSIIQYTTDGRGSVNNHSSLEVARLIDNSSAVVSDYLNLGTVVKRYSDQLSTDKEVVCQVVADMISAHRAQNYGIVFGSHGSGWLPTLTGSRSIGQDGAITNTIQIPELADALEAANPQGFDFVLFDACMMADAEVCYELRNTTRYCVASVLDIPSSGLPYSVILPYLYHADLAESLPAVCREYVGYYNGNAWGTASVIDCSQMEALAVATREMLLAYRENMNLVDVAKIQEYGRNRLGNSSFVGNAYDMVQYAEALCGGEAPARFMEKFRQTVVYTDYTPRSAVPYFEIDGDHYCGLGMYIPNVSTASRYVSTLWDPYFKKDIAWYAVAGWADTQAIWSKR